MNVRCSKRFHSRSQPEVGYWKCHRSGVTMTELVISSVLLMTVIGFVSTLSLQINSVWRDIGHHRIARGELSNQLESLTRASPRDVQTRLNSLVPSGTCARTLHDPKLVGTLIEDEFGIRIVLQLNWKRRNPGTPVELVGWLKPVQAEVDP